MTEGAETRDSTRRPELALVITILDPRSYFAPLSLAITDRAADGSYALGMVSVQ